MTVIAFDGEILAADGQVSTDSGHIVELYCNKLYNLKGAIYKKDRLLYAGFAGNSVHIEKVVDALFGNRPASSDYDVDGIIIGTRHNYVLEASTNILVPNYDRFISAGAGHLTALSAMHLGLNAIDACRHTAKFNIHCNSNITFITLVNELGEKHAKNSICVSYDNGDESIYHNR